MIALIKRDLRSYRTLMIIQLLIMGLYAYLNIRFGSIDGIVGFLVIFLPTATALIMFLGDYTLQAYFTALPVNRKDIVLSKYISTLIVCLMMLVITIGIMWFLSYNYPNARVDLKHLLSPRGYLFALLPMSLIISITYPVLFKYGFSVGARILIVTLFLSYAIGTIAGENFIKLTVSVTRRGIFPVAMAFLKHIETKVEPLILYTSISLILILFMSVSVFLSVRCYKIKDIQ